MRYDNELYQWTIEQAAAALRSRALDALDYDNLAEEIESSGKRDRREIESRPRRSRAKEVLSSA